ncbi:dual-specificity protein phosphatase sdp1-related [Anaeramoeba flamelloides]|uniref:protein-tyrosine-phosphatase n=1 Tax=Anaeramoeba flamelloides TaxID=1746091 RepID=A0AAV7ZQK6_9EUKA|nr:dual-specificity protein phosphatase sdp1-related [Anaeramoeba flamelloides]
MNDIRLINSLRFYNYLCNLRNDLLVLHLQTEENKEKIVRGSQKVNLKDFSEKDFYQKTVKAIKNLTLQSQFRKCTLKKIILICEQDLLSDNNSVVIKVYSQLVKLNFPYVAFLRTPIAAFFKEFPFLQNSNTISQVIPYWQYPSIIIENFLFLGGYQAQKTNIIVHSFDIQYILSVCERDDPDNTDELKNNGVVIKKFPILDIASFDILNYFEEICSFITKAKEKKKRILVHCQAGLSRSPTCVIAWLMKTKHWKYKKARKFVKRKRNIQPNKGFVKALKKWEIIQKNHNFSKK